MRVIAVTIAVASLAIACTAHAVDFEQRIEADKDGTVEISNLAGSIRVIGWDRNLVEVKANYGKAVDRIDVSRLDDRVTIRAILQRRTWNDADVDIDVRVPRESELEISSVSANIQVTGVQGSQRLKSVSGDVRADAGGSELQVKTVSGTVTLRGSPQLEEARVETISGDLRLDRARGELVVTTVSGNLELELDQAESLRARSTSGRIEVRGSMLPDAEIDAETVSGSLDFKVRLPSGLEYEVTTFSGQIRSCFGTEPVRTSKYGAGSRLQGERGEGEAQVRARTMSGNVDLCDH